MRDAVVCEEKRIRLRLDTNADANTDVFVDTQMYKVVWIEGHDEQVS